MLHSLATHWVLHEPQQQYDLWACQECRFSGHALDLLNQNLDLTRSPGDPCIHWCWRHMTLEPNSLEQCFSITFIFSNGNLHPNEILGRNVSNISEEELLQWRQGWGVCLPRPLMAVPPPTPLCDSCFYFCGGGKDSKCMYPNASWPRGHRLPLRVSEQFLSTGIFGVVK